MVKENKFRFRPKLFFFSLQTHLIRSSSHFYDVLTQTIVPTIESQVKSSSMNPNEILSVETETNPLTTKSKRANYMSKLRGDRDSEYRRIERENNAKAMRRKRREDPAYREHERRQNRVHMAELRRENAEYRQREHEKNRHRMALKRNVTTREISSQDNQIELETNRNDPMINSIYQTLENNLQAAHISFIPYQTSCSTLTFDPQRRNSSKQKSEFEFLQQVDEFCRQEEKNSSNNRTTLSSC